LVSPESSSIDLHLPQADANRPRRSHFAKAHSPASSVSSGDLNDSASPIPGDKKEKPRVPKLPIAAMKNSPILGTRTPSSATSPAMSPKGIPQFLTKIGEGIAHFIHESYFGKKSLAQHDMRHAALLGCSQIPDYLSLRDSDKVTYSPAMYDDLVTAVTKKFTSEVLPQFLNSVSFQVMVLSLMINGQLSKEKKEEQPTTEAELAEISPEFKLDDILKEMWQAAKGEQKQEDKNKSESDDSSSTTSTSSDDDDDDDKNSEEKKDERKGHSESKENNPEEKTGNESDACDNSDSE